MFFLIRVLIRFYYLLLHNLYPINKPLREVFLL